MKYKSFFKRFHLIAGMLFCICLMFINICVIEASENENFSFSRTGNYKASISGYSGNETKVDIPDTIIYNDVEYTITEIDSNAFSNRHAIHAVIIPASVTLIDEAAFYNCSSLKQIYYRGTEEQWEDVIILPYHNERILSASVQFEYELNADKLKYVINEDNAVKITGCDKAVTAVGIPEQIDGYKVTEIDDNAFSYCTELSSVNLPKGLKKIGDFAFSGCAKLEKIELPDGINEIGKMCFINSGIKSIIVPKGMSEIGDYTFYGCTNLTNIILHENISGIGNFAFYDCKQLENIELPNLVQTIGDNAFQNCSKLKTIQIPINVEDIGNSVFSGCLELKEIVVDDNNKNYIDIDGVLFTGDMYELICCPSSKEETIYKIPEGTRKIGDSAFYSCKYLTKITLPEKATYIEDYVFVDCGNLESIIIPNTFIGVGDDLFFGCNKLKNIYFLGSEREWTSLMRKNLSSLRNVAVHYNYEYNETGLGDVNGDSKVNASDALLVLKHAAGICVLDESGLEKADVNKDDFVNATDALMILKYSANIIDSFN